MRPKYLGEEVQPPMCGQGLVQKILGKQNKRQQSFLLETPESSASSTSIFCTSSASKNNGRQRVPIEYDDMVSLELAQDTESTSSRASSSKKNKRKNGITTEDEPLPNYIVQFDPKELDKVELEKQEADVAAAKSSAKKQGHKRKPPSPELKQITIQAFPVSMPLPPVTEERSFDIDTPKNNASAPKKSIETSLLQLSESLQYTASWSSCSSSLLLEGVVSEESGEEGIEVTAQHTKDKKKKSSSSPPKNVPSKASTSVANTRKVAEKQSVKPNLLQKSNISSPEKMQLLATMRQVVLKQQDAIKELSDQNVQCKELLVLCQSEMKAMKQEKNVQQSRVSELIREKEEIETENVSLRQKLKSLKLGVEVKQRNRDQQDRISQLLREKEALELETSTLKQELQAVKAELAEMKADDEKLQSQFKSLLDDDDAELTDDDSLSLGSDMDSEVSEKENAPEKDAHKWDELLNMSRNEAPDTQRDSEWLQTVATSVLFAKTHGSSREARSRVEKNGLATGDKVVAVASKETDSTASMSRRSSSVVDERFAEKKKDNVAMFRERLGAIQQKRKSRNTKGPAGTKSVRFG